MDISAVSLPETIYHNDPGFGLMDMVRMTRTVVAERPEHTYTKRWMYSLDDEDDGGAYACRYLWHEDEGEWCPDCVMGHVMVRLGVTLDRILGFEGSSIRQVLYLLFDPLDRRVFDRRPEMTWLRYVQIWQDDDGGCAGAGGQSWGAAVASADLTIVNMFGHSKRLGIEWNPDQAQPFGPFSEETSGKN